MRGYLNQIVRPRDVSAQDLGRPGLQEPGQVLEGMRIEQRSSGFSFGRAKNNGRRIQIAKNTRVVVGDRERTLGDINTLVAVGCWILGPPTDVQEI